MRTSALMTFFRSGALLLDKSNKKRSLSLSKKVLRKKRKIERNNRRRNRLHK